MPIQSNAILQKLVEQIFNKYNKVFHSQREQGTFSKDSSKPLFAELDAVFGDVLKSALRLIDEQLFTIYTTENHLHEIGEIPQGRTAKRVYKLFPNINYCQCDFFAHNVLRIEPPKVPTTSSAKQNTTTYAYTCPHVLAFRLAKLLHAECVRTEVLPKQKFNFLLQSMLTMFATD